MKGQIGSVLIIFHLLSQTSGLFSKESVPVLIWSDQGKPLDIPAVPPYPISFSLVERKLLQTFNQDNVILFQQDVLSVEDLASHGEVFKHVNEFMESGHSLYVPAMEVGVSLPHSFALHGYNIITLEPGSSIGELKLKKGARNLVLVKLPPTSTNPSRKKALQKIDEIIATVLSKIFHLAKFTVMYTGIRTSINLESRGDHHRVVREAGLSAILPARDDPQFHNTGCMILYLRNDMVVEKSNVSYYLLNNHTLDVNSDCQDNGVISIRFTNLYDYRLIKFQMYITKFYRHWAIKSAELSETSLANGDMTTIPLYAQWPMEYVPLNKSYACGKKLVFLSSNLTGSGKTEETLVKLTIDGIQVEAYTHNRTRFSDAWDCVGFFTIPIWMGLFAALILLLILIFGMVMLSDIKTMDRFDDPKGKHFMVCGTAE